MNSVVLRGRLTKDAKLTQNNDPSKNRASFFLAVPNSRDSQKCDYFYVVAWGTKATYIINGFENGRYRKGCSVEVRGEIHVEPYKQENGAERNSVRVDADNTYSEVHPDFKSQNGNYAPNGSDATGYPVNAGTMPQGNAQYTGQAMNPGAAYHVQGNNYPQGAPMGGNAYQPYTQNGYPRPINQGNQNNPNRYPANRQNYSNPQAVQQGGYIPASYQR